VFIGLARPSGETICVEKRFVVDRATFKQLATQTALDLLRRDLMGL
jgi:nicotinamide mononucleotide (NMN) deamidase PncC